ncbi:hypothetical protein H7F37_12330 [Winogradskyella sp. PAMC22761]|nr:hypothetical protein H7F37_12330 [Winogradskyella sp. PAMC22761]
MLEFIKYIYIGFLIIPIYSVFRLLRQYWLYIGYKALNSSFLEWDSKTERARIYLFFLGLLLFISAFTIKNIKPDDSLDYTLLFPSMLICILANLLMALIWTKKFKLRYNSFSDNTTSQKPENSITNNETSKSIELIEVDNNIINEQLYKGYKSKYYSNELDLNIVLDNLPDIKCNIETLESFLQGNKIPKDKKIVSSFNKTDIIRFLIIVYDLKKETSQEIIRTLISHYFLQENNQKEGDSKYNLLYSDSAISRSLTETLYEESKLLTLKKETIIPAFQLAGYKTK